MTQERIDELERLLAEAYQVVSVLATDAGRWSDRDVEKILDNLAECKFVHEDVLPFQSNSTKVHAPVAVQEKRGHYQGFKNIIVDVDRRHGCAFAEGQVEVFVDDLANRLLAGDVAYSPIGQAEIINGIRLLVRQGILPPLKFRDVHTGETVQCEQSGELQDWPLWMPSELWESQLIRLLTPIT